MNNNPVVIPHLWLFTNQKPQAARLRHDPSLSKNHMHPGPGGALNRSISATLFSAIFANLLSRENLWGGEEFITGTRNRQVLLRLSQRSSNQDDGNEGTWPVEAMENSIYTEFNGIVDPGIRTAMSISYGLYSSGCAIY